MFCTSVSSCFSSKYEEKKGRFLSWAEVIIKMCKSYSIFFLHCYIFIFHMFSTACTEGPSTHCVTAAVHLWEVKGTAGITGRTRFSRPYGNRGYRNSCPATRIFTRLLNKQKKDFLCQIYISKIWKNSSLWSCMDESNERWKQLETK